MFCPQSAGLNVKVDFASSSCVHLSSTEQAVKAQNSRISKMNGTLILIYEYVYKIKNARRQISIESRPLRTEGVFLDVIWKKLKIVAPCYLLLPCSGFY
jgi:hypothetical protein